MKVSVFLLIVVVLAFNTVTVVIGQSGSLHLFDADGQDLGILIGLKPRDSGLDTYVTYVPSLDGVIEFSLYRTDRRFPLRVAITSPQMPDLHYTQPNCQGEPFVPAVDWTARIFPFWLPPDPLIEIRYLKVDTSSGDLRVMQSLRPAGGACSLDTGLQLSYRAVEVELPFRYEPKFPLAIKLPE